MKMAWPAAALGLLMVCTRTSLGADLFVTSLGDARADDGAVTLREAILAANLDAAPSPDTPAGNGADTIRFAASLVTAPTSLDLFSALPELNSEVSIVGPGADRLTLRRAGAGALRLLSIAQGARVSVRGLTLANGTSDLGGAISNAGILELRELAVINNSASQGGGVFNAASGTLTLVGTTLAFNAARPGNGGGIFNAGAAALTNSTISGNTSANSGAGFFNSGTLMLVSTTIASNTTTALSGGGLALQGGGATLRNTLLAANQSALFGPDLSRTVGATASSLGHNLVGVGDPGLVAATGDQLGTAANPLLPGLGQLADQAGPTPTHALLTGSPAIDAGFAAGLATDQHGQARPFDIAVVANAVGGDGSDIGAVEVAPALEVVGSEVPGGPLTMIEALSLPTTCAACSPSCTQIYVVGGAQIATYARDAVTGRLAAQQILVQGGRDDAGNPLTGLQNAWWVVATPDGRHVYLAARSPGALTAFRRDPASGRLTLAGTWHEGQVHDGRTVFGLENLDSMTLSPDGHHLYVANGFRHSLALFDRDPASGQLMFIEALKDGGNDAAGNRLSYLGYLDSVCFSPDGAQAYVAAAGAITRFRRDFASGRLTLQDVTPAPLGTAQLAISPDGRHAYTSSGDRPLYARDADTGGLTPIENPYAPVGDPAYRSLWGPITLDLEGRILFKVDLGRNRLAVFRRDLTSGRLALVEGLIGGGQDREGNVLARTEAPRHVTLTADGRQAFVVSDQGGLASLRREVERAAIANGHTMPSPDDGTDFGAARLGEAGPRRRFTVRNPGTYDLHLDGLALPAGFRVLEGLSATLAPGQSDDFTLELETAVGGAVSGEASFTHDAPGASPFRFHLVGLVRGPEITVEGNGRGIVNGNATPAAEDGTDFGAATAVQPPPTRTFTVRNDGDWPLELGTLLVPPGFTLAMGLAARLGPRESDTFTLALESVAAGSFGGFVRFSTDDLDENPFQFAIQGVVQAPELTVLGGGIPIISGDVEPSTADTTDFGTAPQGAAGPSRSFTVRNDGNGPLALSQVFVQAGFAVTEGLSPSLAAGESDTFTLQLTDTAATGAKTALVGFTSDDFDENNFLFAVRATVVQPAVVRGNGLAIAHGDATPATEDHTHFGIGALGQAGPTRTFTVHNDGGVAAVLSGLSVPTGFTVVDGLAGTLAPGASDALTLRMDAATPGPRSGQVSFVSNGENYAFAISGTVLGTTAQFSVQGYGLPIAAGDTSPRVEDGTDFGQAVRGGAAVLRLFTLRNDSATPLLFGPVGAPEGFTVVKDLPGMLLAGASDSLVVQLNTATLGAKTGAVSFATSDPNRDPFQFAIAGRVVAAPDPFAQAAKIGEGPEGTVTANGDGSYSIAGGGVDIWGPNDGLTFHHLAVTGDFDVRVRVAALTPAARWTKAGLMLREAATPNSRMAWVRTTPAAVPTQTGEVGANGVMFAYRTGGLLGGVVGGVQEEPPPPWPVPGYPNCWLRLRRAGNFVSGFHSADGVNWTQLGNAQDTLQWIVNGGVTPLPATVLLGLVVTPGNTSGLVPHAEFRDFGDVVPVAPAIAREPADLAVALGQAARFNLGLTTIFQPSLTIQWLTNGVAVAGAQRRSLELAETTPADDGLSVQAVVASPSGTATSRLATLRVTNGPPVIVLAPSPVNADPGGTVTLAAHVVSGTSVQFQWRRAGQAVADDGRFRGATTPALTVANVQPFRDGGDYVLTARNEAGTVATTVQLGVSAGLDAATFGAAVRLDGPAPDQRLATADLNGDGRLDLIVGNQGDRRVLVWRNQGVPGDLGSASFAAPVSLPVTDQPARVVAGDLDADGRPDLLAVGYLGVLTLLRNASTGGVLDAAAFAQRADLSTRISANHAAVLGDLDGDGRPEITVAHHDSPLLTVFRNQSAPGQWAADSFAAPVETRINGDDMHAPLLSDLDGDGRLDVVDASVDVSVLRNLSTPGQLAAAPLVSLGVGGGARAVADGDLDGDGRPDLVVGSTDAGKLVVLRNDSTPGQLTAASFSRRVELASPGRPNGVVLADLDGDGRLDLASIAVDAARLSLNRNVHRTGLLSAASFAPRVDFRLDPEPLGITAADLDGDGRTDLAITYNGHVSLWRNRAGEEVAPVIVAPPGSQTVIAGAEVRFEILVGGTAPFTYQWFKDGDPVGGATEAALLLPDVQPGDAASYRVRVTNAHGTVTSEPASLIVHQPPQISAQPVSQQVFVGDRVDFSVGATGFPPPTFQWRREDTDIPGATGDLLTLPAARLADAGTYTVRVANAAGSVTSAPAVLTVAPDPGRLVLAGAVGGAPGATATLPVALRALGNENGLAFSLNFDPALLSFVEATVGSGAASATLNVNPGEAAQGRLGLSLVLPAAVVFPRGTQEVARVTFLVGSDAGSLGLPVRFSDSPLIREVSDVLAEPLPATYFDGAITVGDAYEADVTPVPDGNRLVTVTDWVKVGRYSAGLDVPPSPVQFQRADCAPRPTLGNGRLSVSDWVQAGRYAAGLDPLAAAGGPLVPAGDGPNATPGRPRLHAPAKASTGRRLTIMDTPVAPGSTGVVSVVLEALGGEAALGFSLQFDPDRASFVEARPGDGAAGATLNVNGLDSRDGRIGLALSLPVGTAFAGGRHEVARLHFAVPPSFAESVPLTLVDRPVLREFSDVLANSLDAEFIAGRLTPPGSPAQPLRFLTPELTPEGFWRLKLANADGSAIDPARVLRIELQVASRLAPAPAAWQRLLPVLELKDGVVEFHEPAQTTGPERYYRAVEGR